MGPLVSSSSDTHAIQQDSLSLHRASRTPQHLRLSPDLSLCDSGPVLVLLWPCPSLVCSQHSSQRNSGQDAPAQAPQWLHLTQPTQRSLWLGQTCLTQPFPPWSWLTTLQPQQATSLLYPRAVLPPAQTSVLCAGRSSFRGCSTAPVP